MVGMFVLFMLVVSPGFVLGEEPTVEQQIADAVTPLPASLQNGATIVLEAEPGKRTVLREGTNAMLCRADAPAPGFTVSCYHKALDAFFSRWGELVRAGKPEGEVRDTLSAEVKAGKFKVEAGQTTYDLIGGGWRKESIPMSAVFLPNATTESTGLSTEFNPYRPWLMWAGTPIAHIMLPGQ